jgi:UDP-glucose 4-epimerase
MKRILVIGGAGFIGSALVAELQNYHHEIFVIDNLSFGNRKFINIPNAHFFGLDILNQIELHQAITAIDPQWIVHLAAVHFIPYCNQHPFESSNINIQGTLNVLDVAKSLKHLEKLFFASTAAVYPICDDATSEEQPTGAMDIYGLTKLTGEHLMNEFYLQTSIPTLICRFFNAFGPNETNPHLIPEIQRQVNAGLRIIQLGNLDPKRDFIHTFDMARAVRLLMEKFSRGIDVFNLGRGEEYSVMEVVKAFERQLGEPVTIEVESSRVRKVERMHLLADISKLKAYIDWQPEMSLDQGIKTLIQVQPALVK